jgi:hypothetical protein
VADVPVQPVPVLDLEDLSHDRVVLEILADMRRVDNRVDPECLEIGPAADTGQHEELGRADRALADDNFALGRERVFLVVRPNDDDSGSRLVLVKDDALGDGVGAKCDVGFALDEKAGIGSDTIVYRIDAPLCQLIPLLHQEEAHLNRPFCSPW